MYKHNFLSGVTTVGKTPTVSGCGKKLSASGSMFLAGVFRSSGRISFALGVEQTREVANIIDYDAWS